MVESTNTPPPVFQQPEPPPTPVNPLLGRVQLPGESFTLPSRSLFYTNGEVSERCRQTGEIHIHPMTAIDEIVLRSPDKVLSGDAVMEVFQRCIPDVVQPHELLQKDLDFLVAALRKVSYGETLEMVQKHNCEGAKENTYPINMAEMISRSKSIDPTTMAGIFTLTLENGQVVSLEPMRYKDVLLMMQTVNDDVLNPEVQEMYLLTSLCNVVKSVDEISDKSMIEEWVRTIPISWAHQLSEAIDKTAAWGPDFVVHTTCKDCGEALEIQAPMNPISFFT